MNSNFSRQSRAVGNNESLNEGSRKAKLYRVQGKLVSFSEVLSSFTIVLASLKIAQLAGLSG